MTPGHDDSPPEVDLAAIYAAHALEGSERAAALRERGIVALTGGMNNAVYAFGAGRRRYCAKLYKVDDCRRAEREWRALSLLAARGLDVAPRPRRYAPDRDPPAVVMEFVPGTPLSCQPPGRRESLALVEALRPVYAITPATADYPYPMIGRPADRIARVRLLAKQVGARPEEPLAAAVLPLVREWLAGDDEAILLAPAPPVFARGDPNFANCLWDGARVRLVDFEYAGWSDLAFELADLVEGLWAQRIGDDQWADLLPRLGLRGGDRPRFEAARRLCAVFWLFLIWDRRERGKAVDELLAAQIARAGLILGRRGRG